METTVPLENLESAERARITLLTNPCSPMLISLVALLVSPRSIVRSPLALQFEILSLRQQIGVLQRSVRKRPKLTPADRLFWASLSRLWRDWRSTLVLVKPETVIGWQRQGFRLFWTWKVRHGQPGRPAVARKT